MKRKLLFLSSMALTLSMVAAGISAASTSETVDITFTSPLVVGETDRATGRIENMSPEAKRLGINGIRVSGEVKVEKQSQAESRMQIRWTEVSVDNEAGESVTSSLEKPLESRFRTQAPAVRPGSQVKARGDMAILNKALEGVLAKKDDAGAGRERETAKKEEKGTSDDRVSRSRSSGAAGTGVGADPDQYNAAPQLTPANELCSPLVDKAAGTVTAQTRRVVLDADGNVIADGGCQPTGTPAAIQTDYAGCPVHIDHKQMKAYAVYRKYALVDGKSVEVQSCTVDLQKEIEQKLDYASCPVHIDHKQMKAYAAYRKYAMVNGKSLEVQGCTVDFQKEIEQKQDYAGCPIHIDHEEMKAYRTYRKYAQVDGKSLEIQGCTVDTAKELPREQDYGSCSVMIPSMAAGQPVYSAFRWIARDKENDKRYVVSDCVRDLNNPGTLESQTAVCGDDTSSRQDGFVYPKERLVYRDSKGAEIVAANCRRVESHPGYVVTETHEGCDSAELEGTAGKTIIRPKTRLVYFDADGVQREARACQPTAETSEVKYRVVGWNHAKGYSELLAEQTYDFKGGTWYWKDGKPSVLAKVNHTYTTAGCAAINHNLATHNSYQQTRALVDTKGTAFDPVRSQIKADSNGFVEAKGCSADSPLTIPHTPAGWSNWSVVSSREVKEENGRIDLGDKCTITWSGDGYAAATLLWRFYYLAGFSWKWSDWGALGSISTPTKWTKTFKVSGPPTISSFPAGNQVSMSYGSDFSFTVNNSNASVLSSEINKICGVYRGALEISKSPNISMTKQPQTENHEYKHSDESGSVKHTVSWERELLASSGPQAFAWAHPESPWNPATGCAAKPNLQPGEAGQICTALNQTRERYRAWNKPKLDQSGNVTGWEIYNDSSHIDRQISYLINK